VTPTPSGTSFSPQRSWASPFRAFLLPGDRRTLASSPSAPALSEKARRPSRGAPAASSHPKSRAPCHTGYLARVGTAALLGFLGLSGSPSDGPRKRPSPSPPDPRVLTGPQPYDKKPDGPQGVPGRQLGCSPHYGAPACLAFRISTPLPPLGRIRRHRTIFSSRRLPASCDTGRSSLECRRPTA